MNDQATIEDIDTAPPSGGLEQTEIAEGIKSVQGAVALFDRIRSGIAAIQAEHPADVEFDLTTPAGMRRAIAGRAAWRDPRIALGKARQAAKAPVLALGRQIDAFAANVEAQLRVGETHYHELIEAEESRREAERQAKARAEEARVEAHRQRIADIRAVAARAVGMTAEQIAEKIALVSRLTIGDDLEEFVAPAINAKAETLLQLQDMHAQALKAEEAAAQAERDRRRLAEAEAELARQRQELAAARAESERLAALAEERRKRVDPEPPAPALELPPAPHPFTELESFQPEPYTETITWIKVEDAMPDADTNVLCFDEESMFVMEGFYDGVDVHDGRQVWRDVTACELGIVTHWAEMPHGPAVEP